MGNGSAFFTITESSCDEGVGGDAGMSFTKHRLDDFCEIIMGQASSGEAYNFEGGWQLIADASDFGEVYRAEKISPFPCSLIQFLYNRCSKYNQFC
jgi:hypothetical protein